MSESFAFTHAIARRPAPSAVKGLRAGDGPDPDFNALLAEHAGYVAALREAGLAVTELEPLDQFPDALFVEDPALVFPEAAIVLNPGAPSRAGEGAFLRPALEALFPQVLTLPRGQADGGDVLAMPDCVHIGLSARTDEAGAQALIDLLAGLGRKARIARTPPGVLHLKTGCSLLDEESVLALPEIIAGGTLPGYRLLPVPDGEEAGANVLRLADRILVSARFPRLADLLDREGYRVVALETGEIAKIDAGLTCMSLRWRSPVG